MALGEETKLGNIRYQVFVSSTYEDLKEERKQVTQAILESDCFPAGMELFPASSKSQWEMIQQVIDESDVYLVIIAGRYGSIKKGKKPISYTEMEFNYARKIDKPIIALIHSNIGSLSSDKCEKSEQGQTLLNQFTEKAKDGRVVKFWNNKDDIKSAVMGALNALKDDLRIKNCGWIKANSDGMSISDKDVEDLTIANDKLSKELQDTERRYNTLLHSHQILRDELFDVQKEKSELKEKLSSTEKKHQETDVLLKMEIVKSERYAKELSESKAKIKKLEKELLSYKFPSYNWEQDDKNDYLMTRMIEKEDSSKFWRTFIQNIQTNQYCVQDGVWLDEMRKDLAKFMNSNIYNFFSIFDNYLEWNLIRDEATEKKNVFRKLNASDQIIYLNSFSSNNIIFSMGSKGSYSKSIIKDEVEKFFSYYFFLLLIHSYHCKSTEVIDEVYERKKYMNKLCNQLVAFVISAI